MGDKQSPVVRAVEAVEALERFYQAVLAAALAVGILLLVSGMHFLGLVWLVGGPTFVFGVQRWED